MRPDLPEPQHAKPEVCKPQNWISQREYFYDVATQLDHLYHDIEQGRFGAAAREGAFFQYLSEIKQAIPKPKDSDTR
jgi:hypothetical protein